MDKIYKKRAYIVGKKVHKKRCNNIDLDNYIEINELIADIKYNKICGQLKDTYIEPLSLYLWKKKSGSYIEQIGDKIRLRKGEKCPVCGMFTYKYPKWASQIFYKDGSHFSFDGIKIC